MTTEDKIKLATAITAVAGLLIGFYQFIQVQAIKAAEPYLQKKLEWCEEAVKTASVIANAKSDAATEILEFWQMYWGVMGLIENARVTDAMVAFGKGLSGSAVTADGPKSAEGPKSNLRGAALNLAHACRDELSREWSAKWARQN